MENIFAQSDILIIQEYHKQIQNLVSRSSKAKDVERSPFPRQVDFWYLSVCIAHRKGYEPLKIIPKNAVKIETGVRLSPDKWRVPTLMLIYLSRICDTKHLLEPSKIMNYLNGLAAAGGQDVIDMIHQGDSDSLWNLVNSIDDMLEGEYFEIRS